MHTSIISTISDYISQAFELAFSDTSEEDMNSLTATILSGKLADLKEKSYTKTTTLSLSKKDDKWIVDKLDTGSDAVDALTGGLVTSLNNLEDTLPSEDEEKTSKANASAAAAPERDLPDGNYKEIGNGTFYLRGPSGSTENGDKIILYPEMDTWPHASIDIELWDMDGSVQTFIYVDGVEMEKQQVGTGYQGSISFGDDELWALTDGKHKVEAIQYQSNDPSKDITFYRSETYTVKNN